MTFIMFLLLNLKKNKQKQKGKIDPQVTHRKLKVEKLMN